MRCSPSAHPAGIPSSSLERDIGADIPSFLGHRALEQAFRVFSVIALWSRHSDPNYFILLLIMLFDFVFGVAFVRTSPHMRLPDGTQKHGQRCGSAVAKSYTGASAPSPVRQLPDTSIPFSPNDLRLSFFKKRYTPCRFSEKSLIFPQPSVRRPLAANRKNAKPASAIAQNRTKPVFSGARSLRCVLSFIFIFNIYKGVIS